MSGRESRHLWVGGLPEGISESGIRDYFSKLVLTSTNGMILLTLSHPDLAKSKEWRYFPKNIVTSGLQPLLTSTMSGAPLKRMRLSTNWKAVTWGRTTSPSPLNGSTVRVRGAITDVPRDLAQKKRRRLQERGISLSWLYIVARVLLWCPPMAIPRLRCVSRGLLCSC